jgi:hypothetical protein
MLVLRDGISVGMTKNMVNFLITLVKTTAFQLLGVFGVFFVFGFILSKLQEWTQMIYAQSVGWKGILWTAWIGTPVHELSHALMAKIFGHTITDLSLFEPDARSGKLGHVSHTYNRLSLYQRIGNFFIGAAPLLLASPILLFMIYYFLPLSRVIFHPLANGFPGWQMLFLTAKQTLGLLINPIHFHSWKFWLFLYVSFAIVSHLAPSKEDRGNMWRGFFWIILTLLVINAVAIASGHNFTHYFISVGQYAGILFGIFTYAVILSIIHLVLATIILLPFRK